MYQGRSQNFFEGGGGFQIFCINKKKLGGRGFEFFSQKKNPSKLKKFIIEGGASLGAPN